MILHKKFKFSCRPYMKCINCSTKSYGTFFFIPYISILYFHPLFHLQVCYRLTIMLLVSSWFTLKRFHVFPSFILLSSFNNFSFIYHLL